MKSILYVGATLMIGASIYGFVDYKRTSKNKQFTGMYESAATTEKTMPEESSVAVAEPVSSKEEKKAGKDVAATAVIKKKNTPELASTVRTAADKSKKMRSKKLDHRLFSRAPLREDEEKVKRPLPVADSASKDVMPKAEL